MSDPTGLPKLFQPVRVGDTPLGHRVVFAPLTRCRANKRGMQTGIGVEYYAQRASFPGTLLISEATYVSSFAQGRSPHAPGIFNQEQIASWKRVRCTGGRGQRCVAHHGCSQVADAVHAKGSFIFMQIWALGRAARTATIERKEYPDLSCVSASDIPLKGRDDVGHPRPLTIPG